MSTLIAQLVEPNNTDDVYKANVWLLADDSTVAAHTSGLEIAQISPWVKGFSWQSKVKAAAMSKLALIILPPAHRVHVHLLKVNKGQAKYLAETIPVLMESKLGQSIENTHFVSKLIAEHQVLVSAVSRDQMSIWQALTADIDAFKKSMIAPQVFLHTLFDEETGSILFLNEIYRCEKGHIFSVPSVLQQAGGEISKTLHVDFLVDTLSKWKSWQGVTLLSAGFAVASSRQMSSRFFKFTALALVASLLLVCAGLSYQTSVNRAQAAYIEKKGKTAFLALAPEEGRVISLRRQIEGRLRSLAATKSSNSIMYSPYRVLSKIEEAKKNTPGEHSPELIAYRDGVYILEWVAKDQETLDRLRQNLKQVKLDAYLDQVILKDKRYVGSYRIQGAL
ncbi:GspL cytoplasmic actin-ATPase-like region [Marinomonas spartinae]|uniref:GspL cytoplasmic actin-ATPase-like region n=1 Tax=Marinomonas spartinae TaxID=1792290 RepID=A0A1A8TV73_9GAMM|nr:type II secretion system protein GspL [Marinomonas spartinae]SBS35283.1 GspL cytoplasmic actin-ATPase-like region [Marinomonas spartinae]SBS37939.1 GspL cytoplasmic actin-ATPase-like region [Marinomonas spartinae]